MKKTALDIMVEEPAQPVRIWAQPKGCRNNAETQGVCSGSR